MRIGTGYDVHKLVEGRKLIMGGVRIPYEKGLLGHSDADVLAHAIMDALLGAAALGDIGKHFPDTDERYKGADSMELMREVRRILEENCFLIGNVDATIIAHGRMARIYGTRRGNLCAGGRADHISYGSGCSTFIQFGRRMRGLSGQTVNELSVKNRLKAVMLPIINKARNKNEDL